jgi:hypothetical protein
VVFKVAEKGDCLGRPWRCERIGVRVSVRNRKLDVHFVGEDTVQAAAVWGKLSD